MLLLDCMIMHSVISLNSVPPWIIDEPSLFASFTFTCADGVSKKSGEKGTETYCSYWWCSAAQWLGVWILISFYYSVRWWGGKPEVVLAAFQWTSNSPVQSEKTKKTKPQHHSIHPSFTEVFSVFFLCHSVLFSLQPSLCLFWAFFMIDDLSFSFSVSLPLCILSPLLQGVGQEQGKRSCRPYEYYGFRNLSDGVEKATVVSFDKCILVALGWHWQNDAGIPFLNM